MQKKKKNPQMTVFSSSPIWRADRIQVAYRSAMLAVKITLEGAEEKQQSCLKTGRSRRRGKGLAHLKQELLAGKKRAYVGRRWRTVVESTTAVC